MDRSNDWSINWFINWFLGCCSHWKKSYVRILLNDTIKFKRSLQSSIDSSSCKQSAEKIEQLNGFRTSESYDTRTIICLSTKLQANIVIFFCSFQYRPKSVKPASGQNLFFLIKTCFLCVFVIRFLVSKLYLYSTDQTLFSSSCAALSTAEAVKRNSGQAETMKPHTVVQFGQICSRKWSQIHYLKVCLFWKMYSFTLGSKCQRGQVVRASDSQSSGFRIRGPLRPLPGFVSR